MKRAAVLVLVVVGFALGWLLGAPVEIEPVAFQPEPSPLGSAPYSSNGRLARLSLLDLDGAAGPEDLHIDPDGSIVTGVADGRLLRLDRGEVEVLAETGGRPLGLEADGAGGFWVADGLRGLLRVDRKGTVEVVADRYEDRPLRFVDDVDRGPDGRVWFTEADARFGLDQQKSALLEAGPNGSVFVYDPSSGSLESVLSGLHFANGIAISPDGTYAMVTETLRMRVHKLWLQGERRGQSEVVLDNLPGYPDNISSAGGGAYWLALAGPRTPLKDRAMASPFWRTVAARLPGSGLTRPRPHGMVLAVSHLGRVLHFLDDPEGAYSPVTSAHEFGGQLYLGSYEAEGIARVTAPIRR